MFFLITVLILIVLIVVFCMWNWNLIINSIKTSKRDFRGAMTFILVEMRLYHAKKHNLTVNQVFEQTAKNFRSKICFYFEDEEWTFRKVQERVNSVSNYFSQVGFRKGDTVAIYMENRPDYVCLWLGLSKLGVVPALINTNLRMKALEHCLQAANVKGIIFGQELSTSVKELVDEGRLENCPIYAVANTSETKSSGNDIHEYIEKAVDLSAELKVGRTDAPNAVDDVGFNDKLFYIYTSGTTGLPKAAVIKHSRYMMISFACHYVQRVGLDDIVYTALPLYHSSASIVAVGHALHFGASVVFRKKFSASAFWTDCVKYNVTVIQYIGEVCRYLIAQPTKSEEKEHKVRLMFGNGLRADIWTEFLTRFNIPEVREFYGSTEGNCTLAACDNRVGSIGFIPRLVYKSNIYPLQLIKVDEVSGEPLRDPVSGLAIKCGFNEPGEVVGIIKSNTIMDFEGYTDENSKEKKLVRDICRKGDAAFRSGDILMMDELGYMYFKDRHGDTFRWKGENVSTAEVEAVVSRGAEFRETAVYGVAIPGTDGKAGMASILDPTKTMNLEKLANEINSHLPKYARPLFIRLLTHMDMTGTYKIKKVGLRKEGYDITKTTDVIYVSCKGKYIVLDTDLYNSVMSGNVRF